MARLKQDRFFSEKPLRLRSPRESLGGYILLPRFYILLPRLMDKVRLLAKGQLPPSYVQNVLGDKTTLDGRFLLFTDLEPAALRGVLLSTHRDEEVLAWIQDHGRFVTGRKIHFPSSSSLKANAKRQPRHHVGVCPSSRVNIREVEQEGGDETHLLVQGKVQAYADRDQKGGIRPVEAGMQKAEPSLQVHLQSLIESG